MSSARGRPSRSAPAVPRIAFEIDERRLDGPGRGDVLIVVSGEVDFAAGPRLKERLLAHLRGPGSTLVLDLSAVTFIDSMAIGVLVSAAARTQEIGGWLSVVCSSENERVLRIFDIAGVAGVIALHRTLDDALTLSGDVARQRPAETVAPASPHEHQPSAAQPSRPAVARCYAARESSGSPPRALPDRGGHVDELA